MKTFKKINTLFKHHKQIYLINNNLYLTESELINYIDDHNMKDKESLIYKLNRDYVFKVYENNKYILSVKIERS